MYRSVCLGVCVCLCACVANVGSTRENDDRFLMVVTVALRCRTGSRPETKTNVVFDAEEIGRSTSAILEAYIVEGFWHLPLLVLSRMFDLFFVDGPKMLFRTVLGVARLCVLWG